MELYSSTDIHGYLVIVSELGMYIVRCIGRYIDVCIGSCIVLCWLRSASSHHLISSATTSLLEPRRLLEVDDDTTKCIPGIPALHQCQHCTGPLGQKR